MCSAVPYCTYYAQSASVNALLVTNQHICGVELSGLYIVHITCKETTSHALTLCICCHMCDILYLTFLTGAVFLILCVLINNNFLLQEFFDRCYQLWNDPGMVACYARSNEYQLIDCAR